MHINTQKARKYIVGFLIIFTVFNVWLYNIEYKRYVDKAPSLLKPARENFVNAVMFHTYYTFFVKTLRIDFQNPVLLPFKAPRDYFYHQGLALLPKNDAESALWFDFFEVRLYNYSCRASYGSMAETYGYDFAKNFTDEVYKNIEKLTFMKLIDTSNKELGGSALESYLDMIDLYVYDAHLSPRGVLFTDEYINEISKNKTINKRLMNLYIWEKAVLNRYKNTDFEQYEKVMSDTRGWYSPYINFWDRQLVLSSFILFYKISNKTFDCAKDIEYINNISSAHQKLLESASRFAIREKQMSMLNMEIDYLAINGITENKIVNEVSNPFKFSIECLNFKKGVEK